MALIEISSDVLYICQRIKEIDSEYFICFNTDKNRLEVHSHRQQKNTFCLVVPENKLNENLLNYVLKTRIQNQSKIIAEIDKANIKLQKQKEKKLIEDATASFYEAVKSLK